MRIKRTDKVGKNQAAGLLNDFVATSGVEYVGK